MADFLENIGLSLKEARNKQNLSQQDMSAQTGINRSVISKIETGSYTGSLTKLVTYLDHMGLELHTRSKAFSYPQFDELDSEFREFLQE
jgi:transcriptional regulator with XRE-family HTH domain